MKNSTDAGFDQHYNAQVVVSQGSLLVVGTALSPHPNDQQEVAPTLDAIPPAVGTPQAAVFDAGFFSAANIRACLERGIEPYIAPGRDAHHQTLQDRLAPPPQPPPADASPRVQMAYKLQTPEGKALYRTRKYTVEPVLGIIKEVLGFRQFSLRGEIAAAGEWCLVCLAYNLKRLHVLLGGVLPSVALARLAAPTTRSETDPSRVGEQGVASCLWLRFGSVAQQSPSRTHWHATLPAILPPGLSFCLFSPTDC
jgi:hypothetical protein